MLVDCFLDYMVATETDPRLSLFPARLTTLGGVDATWRKRVHLRGGREGGKEEQSEKVKKKRKRGRREEKE